MARRGRVSIQPAQESSPESVEEVSLEEEMVDPSALTTPESKTVTLAPSGSDDELYQRRGNSSGDIPEPAAMLTEDRLLDNTGRNREAPEGFWQYLLYVLTFRLVNVGDSRAVRERKAMDRRIATVFEHGARYVPVLTRKGGVGKTTVTTLLGMAMALVRDDRVIAIDANPDRGTLAERVPKSTGATVRDVVKLAA